MTDRLLTPDALRDIAVKYHPDQLYALYLGADVNVNDYHTKRSVDAHYTDIPALLAHIRAQDAALARLRDACATARRTCNVSLQEYEWCTACKWTAADNGEYIHAPDCPVAAALALLDGDKTDEGG